MMVMTHLPPYHWNYLMKNMIPSLNKEIVNEILNHLSGMFTEPGHNYGIPRLIIY